MTVYLINIILILFWRLFYTKNRVADPRKYYCMIVAIQWILISGLRDWSIGADTENYYAIFERSKIVSWGNIFGNLFNVLLQEAFDVEIGYVAITKLFQLFFGNYQLFLIAIAAFFMSMMAVWIYRNSSSPCTSFILFSTLFYSFYAITGHRQTIATALVVFFGYELIKKREFWKFTALVVVAFLIHKSSLAFAPLYFIARIPITMGYMILCAVIAVVVVLLGESFYGPVAKWIGYEEYLGYTKGGAELYTTLLVMLCIVIWWLYPRIKKHREDAQLLFHINAMTLISGLLVFREHAFMRIQQYFALFLMITIPEVINTLKREHRLLGYMLFGAVMIAYLIVQKPEYKFFFMS